MNLCGSLASQKQAAAGNQVEPGHATGFVAAGHIPVVTSSCDSRACTRLPVRR